MARRQAGLRGLPPFAASPDPALPPCRASGPPHLRLPFRALLRSWPRATTIGRPPSLVASSPGIRPGARAPLAPPSSSPRASTPGPDVAALPFGSELPSSRVPFRPRGFAPPRQLSPHGDRGFVAPRYRPWGSSRFLAEAIPRDAPTPRRMFLSDSQHRVTAACCPRAVPLPRSRARLCSTLAGRSQDLGAPTPDALRGRSASLVRFRRRRRLQGFAPSSSPWRQPAVSSWRSLDPSWAFAPLRGSRSYRSGAPTDEPRGLARRRSGIPPKVPAHPRG